MLKNYIGFNMLGADSNFLFFHFFSCI